MKIIYWGTIAVVTILAGCTDSRMVAGYSGANLTAESEILKDAAMQTTQIEIEFEGPWELYAGGSDRAIDFSRTIAEGEGAGMFEVTAPFSPRSYFQLITPDGRAIIAERRLPLEGGHNYRDMGGYRTSDGLYVRWGKVFRTDDMHNLTTGDLDYLTALNLHTVVDFRSEKEASEDPDKLPTSVTNHRLLPISPGNMTDVTQAELEDAEKNAQYMADINRIFSTNEEIVAQYRELFRLLQDESNLPLSFHCTAGKDRTGMGAALFLASLGVDEQAIMKDYLLSNNYLAEKYGQYMEKYPALVPLFTVESGYLQAGFDQIRTDHGTIGNYLKNILHVDIDRMREIYLYK